MILCHIMLYISYISSGFNNIAGYKERLITYTCGTGDLEVKQHAECIGDCCYTKCHEGYVAVGTYPLCNCVQNKWDDSGASHHQGMIVQDTIDEILQGFP